MVRDLAKFPPGPAQVPTGTQRLAEEQRDAPQVRPHEEAPSPSHAAPPAIPRIAALATKVATVPAAYIADRAAGVAALRDAGLARALSKGRCEKKKRAPGG